MLSDEMKVRESLPCPICTPWYDKEEKPHHDPNCEWFNLQVDLIQARQALAATRAKLKVVHEALRDTAHDCDYEVCRHCDGFWSIMRNGEERHAKNCPARPTFLEEEE